ncbi:hypothetical protein [Corynebacterium accolens]|uniref:hypothetical protein n=1 Tax=Corynebacterium accolens TaxID=38284 RepID=UPI00307FDBD2
MKWDRRTPLNEVDPKIFTDFGYKTPPSKLKQTVGTLQAKIEYSTIEVPVNKPHILNKIGIVTPPRSLDIRNRKVGLTPSQNQFAQVQAMLAEKKAEVTVRLNQRDVDYVLNPSTGKTELSVTSRGRPDLNFIYKNGRSIKTEFDRPPASRVLRHAQQQLDANPDADIWLLTLDNIDESSELGKVIKANRDGVDNYVASLREGI